MSVIRRTLAAAAVTLAAMGPASAQLNVTLTGFTNGYANVGNTLTGVVPVGQMRGLLNGVAFETYCTDLYETVYLNQPYSNYFYAPTDSAHGLTSSQASMIGRLYSVADAGGAVQVNSLDESVAFQLAIWEVLYETGAYNLNAGSFHATTGGNANQRSLANHWLAAASSLGSSQFNVVRIASIDSLGQQNGRQDLVVATPVPEPSTYALLAAGLGVVGFVARRRRPVG
jgi:hypothetical protein